MTRLFMTGLEAGTLDVFNGCLGTAQFRTATLQARTGLRSLEFWRLGPIAPGAMYRFLPSNPAEIYIRLGLFPTDYFSTNPATFLCLRDGAGADQLTFNVNIVSGSRAIEARRGAPNGTLLASGGEVSLNAWSCIEIRAKVADAGGIVQVKVNGVQVIDYTGDTKASALANIGTAYFGGTLANWQVVGFWDDIAINDTLGADNNSWIGRGGIYCALPTGVGQYSQLTPSAGANWECVDDVPPNEDTDHVSSAVVDNKDLYGMADLTLGSGVISAVQWLGRAKLAAAGTGNVARLLRTNAVDYQGSDLAVDTSYKELAEILATNPNTSAAWTIAEVNALEAGVVVR